VVSDVLPADIRCMVSLQVHRRLRLVAALVTALGTAVSCPGRLKADAAIEVGQGDAEGDCPGQVDEPVASDAGEAALDTWVVSTRRLPGICRLPADVTFDVERLTDDGACRRWQRTELASLLAEPARPLVVFVHGNRYEAADAKAQGLRLGHRLAQRLPAGPPPSLVIFSWPSQKQGLLLKDGRRKYDRAYADGNYLAWFLSQVEPERPVAVVGYSFGALVAAEALRELDGLAPGGIAWAERPGRTQLVFVAPALRSDALSPRGPFRETLAGLDRLTLLINSRDEALRFFPLLEPAVKAPALGFVGMPRRWLPAEVEYDASDAAGIVGKLHTMRRYLDSRPLADRIAAGALDGLGGE
jgi:pimeloyl-ACP methyl ester carboxylesterase